MYTSIQESSVIEGAYLKELTMKQVSDIQNAAKEEVTYNQGAALIALSYYSDSGCTTRLFSGAEDVMNQLPPRLFESTLNEVLEFNHISGSESETTENPT